jgi:hypothetical protein
MDELDKLQRLAYQGLAGAMRALNISFIKIPKIKKKETNKNFEVIHPIVLW